MRFCSEKVLEYLRNNFYGLVATMRNYEYSAGQRVTLVDCMGNVIGYGVVRCVKPVGEEVLRKWLKYSGFSSVDEWMAEARRLHGRRPRYVCLVQVLSIKKEFLRRKA